MKNRDRIINLLKKVEASYPVTSGDHETCLLCGRHWREWQNATFDENKHPHNPDCPFIESTKLIKILTP